MLRDVLAIGTENYAVDGTFSGGDWVDSGTITLENLATPYMSEVARSSSADAEDTQFSVDLGRARTVGVIGLGNTSIRPTAQWRIRAYQDDGLTVTIYDSGVIDIPGTTVSSLSLEWEDDGFWEGLSQEFDDLMKGVTLIHLPPDDVYARFWLVEVFDEGNPAGYVDIGAAYVGSRWQPDHNASYGSNELGFEDLTDEEESRNGTKFFNDRNIRRIMAFALEYLPDEMEARNIYRLSMRARRSRQILFIMFPLQPETYQREAFFGTLRQLPPIHRNSFQTIHTNFLIEESL